MPRRTTAKFGTQPRDDHVQDFCWFFVSIGVVVTKKWHFKQKYLNVNKHFAALTAGAGQSSYSRPTGGNGLYRE